MSPALRVEALATGYGDLRVVRDVSFTAGSGQVTVILGRNGAGKTTTLLATAGLLRAMGGQILLDGQDVTALPAHRRVRLGLALVPENKRIFRRRTVEANLRLGGWVQRHNRTKFHELLDRSYDLFPALADRRRAIAGSLSGGQQQMVAIAQALMADPRVLLLDEPSAGLAPAIVNDVLSTCTRLAVTGLAVVIVEQLLEHVLPLADDVVVIEQGQVAFSAQRGSLDHERLREIYLGRPRTPALTTAPTPALTQSLR